MDTFIRSLLLVLCLSAEVTCDAYSESVEFHPHSQEWYNCLAGPPGGVATPNHNVTLAVGSHLQITCTLNPAKHPRQIPRNATSRDLYFANADASKRKIDSSLVTAVDDKRIQLHLGKVTLSDGHISYACYYLKETKNFEMCSTIVTVGYPPLEVQNFTCKSSYDRRDIECTWTEPSNYNGAMYILEYKDSSGTWVSCPKGDNADRCYMDATTTPAYQPEQQYYEFRMLASNDIAKNVTWHYRVDNYAVVVPGVVEKVQYASTSPGSVLISWELSERMKSFPRPLTHRVEYRCDCQDLDSWQNVDTAVLKISERLTQRIDINRYGNFECESRITSKSSVSRDMPATWSLPATIRFPSPAAKSRPPRPPIASENNFEVSGGQIILYWQSLSDCEKNGDELHYEISAFAGDGKKLGLPTSVNGITDTSTSLQDSEPHTDIAFQIHAVNEIGRSDRYSTIKVPNSERRLSPPESLIVRKLANDRYNFSWQPPFNAAYSNIISYTIHTCYENTCKTLKSADVSPDISSYIIKTGENDGNNSQQHIRVAVSANSKDSSSGLVWSNCYLNDEKDCDAAVRNVSAKDISNTSVAISWRLPEEMCRSAYFFSFTVSNRTYGSGFFYVNVSADEPDISDGKYAYVLDDLQPYTDYNIFIRMCTCAACTLKSNVMAFRTLVGVPDVMDAPDWDIWGNRKVSFSWRPPLLPAGPISYYEIMSVDSTSTDKIMVVSPDRNEAAFILDEDEDMSSPIKRFAIRAVNVEDDNTTLAGSWSPYAEVDFSLSAGLSSVAWIIIFVVVTVSGVVAAVFASRKLYHVLKAEVDINLVLPGQLYNPSLLDVVDRKLMSWSRYDGGGNRNVYEEIYPVHGQIIRDVASFPSEKTYDYAGEDDPFLPTIPEEEEPIVVFSKFGEVIAQSTDNTSDKLAATEETDESTETKATADNSEANYVLIPTDVHPNKIENEPKESSFAGGYVKWPSTPILQREFAPSSYVQVADLANIQQPKSGLAYCTIPSMKREPADGPATENKPKISTFGDGYIKWPSTPTLQKEFAPASYIQVADMEKIPLPKTEQTSNYIIPSTKRELHTVLKEQQCNNNDGPPEKKPEGSTFEDGYISWSSIPKSQEEFAPGSYVQVADVGKIPLPKVEQTSNSIIPASTKKEQYTMLNEQQCDNDGPTEKKPKGSTFGRGYISWSSIPKHQEEFAPGSYVRVADVEKIPLPKIEQMSNSIIPSTKTKNAMLDEGLHCKKDEQCAERSTKAPFLNCGA